MWAAEKTAAQERHALGFEPAPPVLEQQDALTLNPNIEPLTLTDRQTDTHSHKQTDTQTDRHTHTDRRTHARNNLGWGGNHHAHMKVVQESFDA